MASKRPVAITIIRMGATENGGGTITRNRKGEVNVTYHELGRSAHDAARAICAAHGIRNPAPRRPRKPKATSPVITAGGDHAHG